MLGHVLAVVGESGEVEAAGIVADLVVIVGVTVPRAPTVGHMSMYV